jgi:hypothetical protein
MPPPSRMLYSLIATTPRPITLSKPPLVLEVGRNVFTVLTDDIDGLVAVLSGEGATVSEVNEFTQPATTPRDMVLEGESPDVILGSAYGGR